MPERSRPHDIEGLLEGLRDDSWSRRADALREATARLVGGEIDRDVELRLATPILDAAKDEKWEVRKAAALAVAELRHVDADAAQMVLESLGEDSNRWVSQAASRASQRIRQKAQRKSEWALTEDTQNPTLHYIHKRIQEIGLRSLTPANIYDLAMDLGEQFYREFAADTAHGIRSLLTPLEGNLVQLSRHLAETGGADMFTQRYIDLAQGPLQHLKALVQQLQDYGVSMARDFQPVDLAGVVREAVGLTNGGASTEGTPPIETDIEVPGGLIIDALPERLTCAINNIVANAIQAMPQGGRLTIRAVLQESDSVILTVSDTGCGMSSEDAEHAVERFRTTRRDEGGTGLGLPIAQRVIEHEHGGQLIIDSEPGKGTRVTIELPVRQDLEGA